MKTKEKTFSKLTRIARCLGLAATMLAGGAAHADIVNGYYSGVLPGFDLDGQDGYNFDSQIFVTTVVERDGSRQHFGIILITNDVDQQFGSIYRIDEVTKGAQKGLQSWVQMFQNERGRMTAEPGQRPTFAVRTVYDGNSWRDAQLQFTVTDFGRTLGCKDAITDAEIRFGFLRGGTWHLTPMPTRHFKLERSRDVADAFYNNQILNGNFKLGDRNISGDFQIVPKFSVSIGELRQGTPDPESESESGVSQKSELMGAIVSYRSHPLIAPKDKFSIIDLPNITEIGKRKDMCYGKATRLIQD